MPTSASLLSGFALTALVSALSEWPPWPAGLLHLGHMVVLGAALHLASRALAGHPRVALLLLALAAGALGFFTLADDLSVVAGRLPGWLRPTRWRDLLSIAAAQALPLAALTAARLPPRLALALGLVLAAAHPHLLPGLYPGLHLVATLVAGLLAGRGLTRTTTHITRHRAMLASAAGLTATLWPPSAPTRSALDESTSAVAAPWVLKLHDAADPAPAALVLTADEQPWYRGRSADPPRPPTAPPFEAPLVILATIDCLRLDVAHDFARFPALGALAAESLDFTQARTPAPSTAPALAALFMGKYYGQLLWRPKALNGATRLWPAEDTSPTVGERLTAAGVPNLFLAPEPDLLAEMGVTRGFQRTEHPAPGFAPEIVTAALAWLADHRQGPAFLAMHFIDPHFPYDRGGTEGSPKERHLREVALVDAELARLRRGLAELGLAERALLVVTADHGENFGERGGKYHGGDLHEVVLRIPLFVRVPGQNAREVETLVSLVDLGPTILDVFGQPTPANFQGESLVPMLRGEHQHLTRPLLVDASRRMQALYLPDGHKIARNLRTGTISLHDLRVDPDERENLFDRSDREHQRRLARLAGFFEVHDLRLPGYEIPWRP